MANKKSNADIDVEDMSNDQLRNMDVDDLGELLGRQDDSNLEEQTQEDTTVELEEEEPEEAEEAEEAEPEAEEIPEVDDEPELTRGKSRSDILKMLADSQQMISRQGNEKHEFKKELQELRDRIEKPVVAEKKDELMDKLADYNQEDIAIIREIIKSENQNIKKSKQVESEKVVKANTEANEMYWNILEKIDPTTSAEIKEDVLKSIQSDISSTLQQSGWLESYVMNYKASKTVPVKNKPNLTTKKLKAKTAGSGSKKVSTSKSVASMTAEEYAEHAGLERLY